MSDSILSLAWAAIQFVQPVVLLALAFMFGRTLSSRSTPLIERIARQSTPDMTPAACRYTRWLTALWCAWFVLSSVLTLVSDMGYRSRSIIIWAGTALLFVGEHAIRPLLLPGETFPGLVQQVRDTVSVWRRK